MENIYKFFFIELDMKNTKKKHIKVMNEFSCFVLKYGIITSKTKKKTKIDPKIYMILSHSTKIKCSFSRQTKYLIPHFIFFFIEMFSILFHINLDNDYRFFFN
jgi:hypothetical protein